MPNQRFLLLILLASPFSVLGQFQARPLGLDNGSFDKNAKILLSKVWLRHPIINKNNPVKYTIVQTRDKNGIPSSYRLQVNSVVCLDSVCEIIKLTMVWDGTGQYSHIELPKGKSLTKGPPSEEDGGISSDASRLAEHLPFSEYDYIKLDSILRDKYSLLKSHQLEEMTSDSVDAKTGATSETIRRSVVPGAAYTCYNLWHWANGDVSRVCDSLTELTCGKSMLVEFLKSDNSNHVLFAIRHLEKHNIFDEEVIKSLKKTLLKGDYLQTEGVFRYLKRLLNEPAIFAKYLSEIFFDTTSPTRVNILMLLGREPDLPLLLLDSLGQELGWVTSYREIHLLLSIFEKHRYTSKILQSQVVKVLQNRDVFIARRAYAYLSKQKIDGDTQKLMIDYQRKLNEN